ncbi:hypothetical protein ES705_27477 [subsurface metagenome]
MFYIASTQHPPPTPPAAGLQYVLPIAMLVCSRPGSRLSFHLPFPGDPMCLGPLPHERDTICQPALYGRPPWLLPQPYTNK